MSNLHHNILALLHYGSGYFTCMVMFTHEELYLRSLGLFVGTFLTYNLISQLDKKSEKDENN